MSQSQPETTELTNDGSDSSALSFLANRREQIEAAAKQPPASA